MANQLAAVPGERVRAAERVLPVVVGEVTLEDVVQQRAPPPPPAWRRRARRVRELAGAHGATLARDRDR